jgi:hypothetical protein
MFNQSHLLRKRAVTASGFAVALVFAAPLFAQVDLGLAPMRLEFPAAPGRAFSGTLTLSNGGKVKTRVRTEMLDLYIDDTTTPQFVPNAPSEADYSCKTWLSANPMEVEIEGGTQVPVRFTVRVPPSAGERSFHCALGFRTLPTESEDTGTSMRTAVRMIATFYPIIGKPAVDGMIKQLSLDHVSNGSDVTWRAVVIMENTGQMFYRPTGDIELLDSDGHVVEAQKMTAFPVLPKRDQRYILPLKAALTPGRYTLHARIDVGHEIQEGSVEVVADVPPSGAPAAPVSAPAAAVAAPTAPAALPAAAQPFK